MREISRGDIWYADLDAAIGSEQQFRRPVLVVQADTLNRSSPTVIILPITSQMKHPFMRAHYILDEKCPLRERSMLLTEQVWAVDKSRLQNYIGKLKEQDMQGVEAALGYSLGLDAKNIFTGGKSDGTHRH